MPQVSHPAFSHMNQKPEAKPPARPFPPAKQGVVAKKPQALATASEAASQTPLIHTVEPPEAEQERFEAQMAAQVATLSTEAPTAFDGIQNGLPGLLDDGALNSEMEKKRVFEKLVLFRQDHITEVTVAGLNFRLKLLNANDNAYVLKHMRAVPGDEQMSKLALMVLAAAIVDVGGVRLEDTYDGPGEITDPVLKRYYELNRWHGPVVNVLSAAYSKFQASIEQEYSGDFLVK